jgi:hypothetical protein
MPAASTVTEQAQQALRVLQLEHAVRQARKGKPWPLVELLWGKLFWADDVLANPAEYRSYQGKKLLLDNFQVDLIESVLDPTIREVYVKGNAGCGKGGSSALAICLYFYIWPDAKVVLTRDGFNSAVKLFFSEVSKWWRRMAYQPASIEVQTGGMVDLNNREHAITVVSPKADEGFSGAHSPHVLIVFDEATSPNLVSRYKLADTQARKFVALANPRTVSGPFYAAFAVVDIEQRDQCQTVRGPLGLRRLITVDGADTLNVRAKCLAQPVAPRGGITLQGKHYQAGDVLPQELLAEVAPLIPGQTCFDEFLGICANPDEDFVAVMGRGRFPREDRELQIVLPSWVRACQEIHNRWQQLRQRATERGSPHLVQRLESWLPVEAFGLDVGGSLRGDPSVLTAGGKRGIRQQLAERYGKSHELVAWVIRVCQDRFGVDLTRGDHPICVDTTGIGWGVADTLEQRGCKVVRWVGSNSATVEPKKYRNLRAESYGEFAKRLDPSGAFAALPFAIEPNPFIRDELAAAEKVLSSDGIAFHVTPKTRHAGMDSSVVTVHDKIGRSPDYADSAVYWYRAQQLVGLPLDKMLDWLWN